MRWLQGHTIYQKFRDEHKPGECQVTASVTSRSVRIYNAEAKIEPSKGEGSTGHKWSKVGHSSLP